GMTEIVRGDDGNGKLPGPRHSSKKGAGIEYPGPFRLARTVRLYGCFAAGAPPAAASLAEAAAWMRWLSAV
ncbi:hypothetical protein, partial [Proteus mirabilis]|uniref:hypothetical protein n=1 Tax=Proteus mirabilis TaxID=584 RepID=UPI001952AAE2